MQERDFGRRAGPFQLNLTAVNIFLMVFLLVSALAR